MGFFSKIISTVKKAFTPEGREEMKVKQAEQRKQIGLPDLPKPETREEAKVRQVEQREKVGLPEPVGADISEQIDPKTGKFLAVATPFKAVTSIAPMGLGSVGKGIKYTQGFANTKISSQVVSWASRIAGSFKNPKVIGAVLISLATASIGGKVFGKFEGMGEAGQAVNIAARDALMRGDLEGYEKAAAERDEVLADNTFWDQVKSWIPFYNVLSGLDDYRDAAIVGGEVYDKIYEDEKIKQETGETDDERWARVRQEQEEQDKRVVDYYNEQRKLMIEWEREAEKAARNEDAAYWRKEAEKQRKKEAEDRQAVADFWLAYRKQIQKLYEDSRPSNLNFGLLK